METGVAQWLVLVECQSNVVNATWDKAFSM